MIYLDYAATYPTPKEINELYRYLESTYPYNPHSLHDLGQHANQIVLSARQVIKNRFNLSDEGIIFTSSGSDSNQLAIDLYLSQIEEQEKSHVISSSVEHSSIYYYLKLLERRGIIEVTYLPVNKTGQISLNDLQSAIRPNTRLVTIQHVNSETGCIQPIKAIGKMLKDKSIPFHSDVAQSFGKHHLNNLFTYVDAISISGHKIKGPKGIGLLLIKHADILTPLYENTQQYGFKQGTLNPALIGSLAQAFSNTMDEEELFFTHTSDLRQYFTEQVQKHHLPLSIIESNDQHSSIIGCVSHAFNGEYIAQELNRHKIYISTRSACQGTVHSNRNLSSLLDDESSHQRFFRISTSLSTTKDEIDHLISQLRVTLFT
ncbi:cysteine desulfurase [Pelagirhabdus alkalitolerans]|uniref:Cysteine desulfurase n=1 Tax=Pelagirhabdus alkalitolerans TaxID=1612202 RepID=A0A1G6HJM3_9BACI|nr:IscS subfamily cysteine desulfurase [Pelagirhabdus alkalitolerans]SDB94115.1 cysteine desulfurase [Pelagirhabdus alkalitolerans]